MELKQVIVVRSDLKMGKGKTAAQAAHASILALDKARSAEPELASDWQNEGSAKVVLKVRNFDELTHLYEDMRKRFPCAIVRDAGLTQVESGSVTCFACGPAPAGELDKYTGKLKLL